MRQFFEAATKRVGLSIRPWAVELVAVSGRTLTQTARVPVKGQDDADILEALQDVMESAQLTTGRLAVSIPSQDILLRFFTLPLLPKSEWEAAIKFEARKHIPFRTEELVWNYHAAEDRGQKQIVVVFAGVKRDRFQQVQKWLKEAKIEPTTIEAQDICLARVVTAAYPELRQDFVVVVEMNNAARVAHIAIVKGPLPYLARDVSLGPIGHTEEPVKSPDMRDAGENVWVAGQSVAASPAGPDPEDERVEHLLRELRLSLDFFTREYPSVSISRLLIYGDDATTKPWYPGLSEQLHCPVEAGRLPFGDPESTSEILLSASSIGTVLPPAGIRLDFLSRIGGQPQGTVVVQDLVQEILSQGLDMLELVKAPELLKALARPLAIQTVVAVIGLVVLAQVSHHQVVRAEVELAEVRQTLAAGALDPEHYSEQTLEDARKEVDGKVSMLQNLFDGRISVTEKLEALAVALPEGLWLESLSYKSRLSKKLIGEVSLSLNGACFLPTRSEEEFVTIGEFSEQLKQDPRFFRGFASAELGDIVSAQLAEQDITYRTFKLSCASARTSQ